ncbi:SitI3 family protein [Actinoplanes sp. CA-030573]|uniref:SitI3 family protein n=1 Tax=Actinoplanes sp. CA-030573 TaxID=3239898 RepID=UPI003D905354
MALEYTFYSAADLTAEELRSHLAAAVGGSIAWDGTVERAGLSVAAWRVAPGEEATAPALFGFPHRVTAIFRFANLERELEPHNTALMVGSVLALQQRTGADGVLLFNGEEAVLLCRAGEAIFGAEWEWEDFPEAAALREGHRVEVLPQPLL